MSDSPELPAAPISGSTSVAPLHTDDHTLHFEGKLPLLPSPKEKHLRPKRWGSGGGNVSTWMGAFGIIVGGSVLGGTLGIGSTAAFAGSIAATFALLFGKLVYDFRRFNEKNSHWVAQLNLGEVDAAHDAFDDLAQKYRGHDRLHTMSVFNIAATEVRKGNLERAIQLYGTVERSRSFRSSSPQVFQMLPFVMGYALVLQGELDAAEQWLEEGEKRRKYEHLKMGEGIRAHLMARRHRYREAVEFLNANWRAIEGSTQADQMRPIRLLKALCLQRTEPESEEIPVLLAGAKPFRPGEYDYLGTRWPEFQSFLGEKGFSR
jgi:hypothetical protein